jgi:hypothetical protein
MPMAFELIRSKLDALNIKMKKNNNIFCHKYLTIKLLQMD